MIAPRHFRVLGLFGLLVLLRCAPSASAQSESAEEIQIQSAPTGTLTFQDRLELERRLNFSPANFAVPALEAGFRMEFPLRGEPANWHEGVGGFARNYAADFALTTTAGFGRFVTDTAVRHDPRYYPSTSANYGRRFLHALAFTVVDNTDSGRRSIAYGNLTGAFAAGGVSMAMYPHGFNDFTHAEQRFKLQVLNFGVHNLFAEFAPEVTRAARFLRIPDRVSGSLLPADRKEP